MSSLGLIAGGSAESALPTLRTSNTDELGYQKRKADENEEDDDSSGFDSSSDSDSPSPPDDTCWPPERRAKSEFISPHKCESLINRGEGMARRNSLPALLSPQEPAKPAMTRMRQRRHSDSSLHTIRVDSSFQPRRRRSLANMAGGVPQFPVLGLVTACADFEELGEAHDRRKLLAVCAMFMRDLGRAVPKLVNLYWWGLSAGLDTLAESVGVRWLRRFSRVHLAAQLQIEPPLTLASQARIWTCAVAGGQLEGTLWLPSDMPGPFPTVIMRTPYGHKTGGFSHVFLAERGFAVLVQDTRGRFTSGGTFVPIQNEREDGAATVAWAKEQPWCNGRVGVSGISYLGFTAWGAMGTCSKDIDAAVIMVSQSRVKRAVLHPGGAISLELCLLWLYLVLHLLGGMDQSFLVFMRRFLAGVWNGTLKRAMMHVPARTLDEMILGRTLPFWQEGVGSFGDPDHPFWDDKDVLCDISGEGPPVHMISAWHDFFLEQCIDDFKSAGPRAKLTVVPASHWGLLKYEQILHQVSLDTFQEHLQGIPCKNPSEARVRIGVFGSDALVGFEDWPPPATTGNWHLRGTGLVRGGEVPCAAWQRSYRYDPADPTPACGGASFNIANNGERDQRSLEKRKDVITFTTEPLTEEIFVAGKVFLELEVEVGSASADFVGRLCDVDTEGKSLNRCEGLTRISGPGARSITVDMGNTCCFFREGHRIRLQVCSGAHPRWMRNLQTGDPVASAVEMRAAQHTVRSGSILKLPVVVPVPHGL